MAIRKYGHISLPDNPETICTSHPSNPEPAETVSFPVGFLVPPRSINSRTLPRALRSTSGRSAPLLSRIATGGIERDGGPGVANCGGSGHRTRRSDAVRRTRDAEDCLSRISAKLIDEASSAGKQMEA